VAVPLEPPPGCPAPLEGEGLGECVSVPVAAEEDEAEGVSVIDTVPLGVRGVVGVTAAVPEGVALAQVLGVTEADWLPSLLAPTVGDRVGEGLALGLWLTLSVTVTVTLGEPLREALCVPLGLWEALGEAPLGVALPAALAVCASVCVTVPEAQAEREGEPDTTGLLLGLRE
jgi:hypothetical protein